jgi:hypothetical protein
MSLDGAALLVVSKNPIVSSPAHREYALSRRQATCTLVASHRTLRDSHRNSAELRKKEREELPVLRMVITRLDRR